MNKLEQCFNVKITIVSLNSSTSVNLLKESFFESENVIYLNNYESHLSYITDYSKVANKCQCEKCNKILKDIDILKDIILIVMKEPNIYFLKAFIKIKKPYLIN